MHPPCDRCNSVIDTESDIHYNVTIEIEAGGLVDSDEFDSNEDRIASIENLLENADQTCSADFSDDWFQTRQYLLCQPCYQAYIRNPLAKPNT